MNNNWTEDYELILEEVRQNSVNQAILHKKKYFYFKQLHFRIRIPTIILSSIGSVVSVGLQSYLGQPHVSAITCLISLLVSIINSIELFLKINENQEIELETSKHYYTLATDIHKLLTLEQFNRLVNPKESLDNFYRRYIDLSEKSNLLSANLYKDVLISLPKKNTFFSKKKNNSNSSSISSNSTPPSPLVQMRQDDNEAEI
jgi:hypothetical protein